jgi:predicted HD phosphohydrolase
MLGDRVAGLVEGHVPAKRYLVATDAAYGSVLSEVSVWSLGEQGGPMIPEEVAEFASGPYASDAVVLRRADDAAKVPGRVVPPLADWLPLLRELAQ